MSSSRTQVRKKKFKTEPAKPAGFAVKHAMHKVKEPSPQEINVLTVLFNQGRYTEVAILAQTMTERYPLHGFAWKVLGAVFRQMGRGKEALVATQKATELLPNDAAVHSNLGNALKDLGQLDDAVACYRRALVIEPDYAQAHSNLGNALKDLGYLDDAVACYRRALVINPVFAEAHSNLGTTLTDLGRLDEAVASCSRALEIRPGYAEARSNLANAMKKLGQLDKAVENYRQALVIKPDFAETHSNLGAVLREIGQLDNAVTSCRRALEIKSDYAEAHGNLGNALKDLGQLDEAVESYRRALAIKPDYALALCNLGHTLCDLDDLGQAAAVYQQALDIDPNDTGLDAAVYLAVLDYLDGNTEQCRIRILKLRPILQTYRSDHMNPRTLSVAYWHYLHKLVAWRQQFSQQDTSAKSLAALRVVGESHSLSAQGVVVSYEGKDMQCVAEWISGCKQWHLGNEKPNKYKCKFELVLARLPRQSPILLTIGEIDCRPDEGIIKACKKLPDKTMDEIVLSTTRSYVKYVAGIAARHGHKVIVGGVPATNFKLETLGHEEAQRLVTLIRTFNAVLKEQTLAAGLDFLDLYALTDRGDGIANGQWHIDDTHLLPSALAEAFGQHRIQPSRLAGRATADQ